MNVNLRNQKHLITLILATMLLSSAFVGITFAFRSGLSPGNADWVIFEGVAGNDYYDSRQYSYKINQWAAEKYPGEDGNYPALTPANMWFNASKSLRIAMTEYGEFATPAGTNAGIAYGYNAAEWAATESWAATAINPALYIQGWVFYMNYSRSTLPRAIEAYAIFSDTAVAESARKVYSWVGDRASNAAGAQLTAGSLTTGGVQVLYDSARLAVGRTSIVIHDGFYNEDVAMVTLTVIYSKVTKYAIVLKDIKILLDPKVLDLIKDISFGERYEIDLARGNNLVNPSNQAYIHYFESYDNSTYQHPLTGDTQYDVVQAFNPNRNYTYFAAYWPNATQYSVYDPLVPDLPNGFTRVLPDGRKRADIPVPADGPGEPNTPWVFAQWRYNYTMWPIMLNFLAKDANREIRFVEVFGMTDYNMGSTAYAPFRAQDLNAGDNANYVDVEIQYLLNSVFNPEDDLNSMDSTEFMWLGVGQASQAVDSLGAAFMDDYFDYVAEPMPFFDKAEPTLGTIPYGLDNVGDFANYIETFSNVGKGTGTDATAYLRTGLIGFAFKWYNGRTGQTPPQPIAGGQTVGTGTDYFYPSKDPLTERWSGETGGPYTLVGYDAVNFAPNGIITVGGPKANGLSRYFNDFNFVVDREGTSAYALANGGVVTGTAPTSNPSIGTFDFYPLTSWASSMSTFNYGSGTAVISAARDVNGTRGFSVYGWDGRDTYWAAGWVNQLLGESDAWLPDGVVAILLHIEYSATNREPTAFHIFKALGTITEFGYNRFADAYGFDAASGPETWQDYIVSNAVPPVTIELTESDEGDVWWWEKFPTTSLARVQFDP